MVEDDVIRELWRVKDSRARRYNYDVRAMARDLRKRQDEGGRKVVAFQPKRPTSAE